MEIPLRPAIEARLKRAKRLVASWRLTVSDLAHDYRDIFARLRDRFVKNLKSLPPITASFGLGLLFVLGVAGGFGLKTLAKATITIGHEDYRLVPAERLSALNELREQALAEGSSLTVNARPEYPVCSTAPEEPTR